MIGYDVISMARQAGMMHTPIGQIEKLYAMAVAAEREACAKVAAGTASPEASPYGDGFNQAAIDIESAIRARG